jgi:RimJ/RimL family protein N-acetyltransferase
MTKFIRTSPLGPTLETERLILRPPVREDFDALCAFHADEATMKHLGGVQSPAAVWRIMCLMAGAWHLDGKHMFCVLDKTSGEWMGRIGPLYPHDWPGREVGWGLHSKFWGKGYAVEAAVAAMDYVTTGLGWDDVIHSIAPDNPGSAAVARKVGSTRRGAGRLPDPHAAVDIDIWGQTADQWRVNRLRFLK